MRPLAKATRLPIDRTLPSARTGTALEMNGSPHRLDLSVERARRALEHGCLL